MIGTIRTKVKAVVVGAKECGKTALITSLYSNLRRLDPRTGFDLDEWEISRFLEDSSANDSHAFDLEGACIRLNDRRCPRYPQQTKDWSVIRMDVELVKRRKEGKWYCWNRLKETGFHRQKKVVSIEILDLPGERLSDLALMLGEKFRKRTFEDWSKGVWGHYKGIGKPDNCEWLSYDGYLNRVKGILSEFKDEVKKCLDGNMPADNSMVASKCNEYKDKIVKEYKKFLPTIRASKVAYYAPSTIRLMEDGKLVPAKNADEFHNALVSGLNETEEGKLVPPDLNTKGSRQVYIGLEGDEFAPLPVEVFEDDECRELIKLFHDSYSKYYKRIVQPIVDKLMHVSQVYYLVDVLNLLRDGREKKDAEVRFGSSLFKIFGNTPSKAPVVAGMVNWLSKLFSSVRKVCLVATQADKVAIWTDQEKKKEHKNMGNVKKLLTSLMMSDIKNAMGDIAAVRPFVCSAITSTDCQTDGQLVAYWENDKEKTSHPRDPVPEEWPNLDDDWEPLKTYPYERPKRCLKAVDPKSSPLPQYNLAAIAKSLLEIQ